MTDELGDLANALFKQKALKTELNAQLKEVNGEITKLEVSLLHNMQDRDHPLHKIADANGTIYIARQVVPKVVNWDEFYEYIRKNGYFHLLERRPSRPAFRESYEQGSQVPGVDPVVFDEVRTRVT